MPNTASEVQKNPSGPWLRLIAGDASDRKFYRLEGSDVSAICMRFPKWEGGYGGDPISWLGMHKVLLEMGIPVPAVLEIDEEKACIWTEDFGDNFLNCSLENDVLDLESSASTLSIDYYKQALDLLVMAQYPTQKHGSHPAQNLFFDTQKLMFEMKFFVTHFLNGVLSLDVNEDASQWKPLFNDFAKLSQWLDSQERVLCHRDYHVRNVMIVDKKAKWIDFQDARMGPHTYDVVSLVRDSYVRISNKTRAHLFRYYFQNMNMARERQGLSPLTREHYDTETLHMGLQRNVKAIGSFGYLATTKGKPGYLSYVRWTLETLTSDACIRTPHCDLTKEYPALMTLLQNLKHGTLAPVLENALKRFGQ
jgi:aminoglycoside/choline kinase family phosphotransferase